MYTKSLDVVNQAAAAEYEIGGIAAILGIIGQYVETEEAELQGDELMSLSTQLFRIKRDLKDAVRRFEESGNNSEGLSDLDNALENHNEAIECVLDLESLDEIMSLSTQLLRIKRGLKDAIQRFEESSNSEALSDLSNAIEYRPYGIGVTEVHKEDV